MPTGLLMLCQTPLIFLVPLVRKLALIIRGLTSSTQSVAKLFESFVEPCSIADFILKGKGLDDDGFNSNIHM